ncbi:hypothetical protein NDU88_005617 [Pleurodeles waltl]|uniref:Uncharacterized protein n=1 Tax=Pleurodeles waltl TaxID=8319 RepID=A0AAV7NN17_PLEWA|nr:hypothetical protein NDU88_005617 [Pleurodeles waltl]
MHQASCTGTVSGGESQQSTLCSPDRADHYCPKTCQKQQTMSTTCTQSSSGCETHEELHPLTPRPHRFLRIRVYVAEDRQLGIPGNSPTLALITTKETINKKGQKDQGARGKKDTENNLNRHWQLHGRKGEKSERERAQEQDLRQGGDEYSRLHHTLNARVAQGNAVRPEPSPRPGWGSTGVM